MSELKENDYLVGVKTVNDDTYQIKVDKSGQANPSTVLKQSMLRYNSELNFKALIPFKLKIFSLPFNHICFESTHICHI